jgi:hypothetical protein
MILVSNSRFNDPLLAMWRTLLITDPAYASNPEMVHDIHAAAADLGLDDAGAAELQSWIDARRAAP